MGFTATTVSTTSLALSRTSRVCRGLFRSTRVELLLFSTWSTAGSSARTSQVSPAHAPHSMVRGRVAPRAASFEIPVWRRMAHHNASRPRVVPNSRRRLKSKSQPAIVTQATIPIAIFTQSFTYPPQITLSANGRCTLCASLVIDSRYLGVRVRDCVFFLVLLCGRVSVGFSRIRTCHGLIQVSEWDCFPGRQGQS